MFIVKAINASPRYWSEYLGSKFDNFALVNRKEALIFSTAKYALEFSCIIQKSKSCINSEWKYYFKFTSFEV